MSQPVAERGQVWKARLLISFLLPVYAYKVQVRYINESPVRGEPGEAVCYGTGGEDVHITLNKNGSLGGFKLVEEAPAE